MTLGEKRIPFVNRRQIGFLSRRGRETSARKMRPTSGDSGGANRFDASETTVAQCRMDSRVSRADPIHSYCTTSCNEWTGGAETAEWGIQSDRDELYTGS